MKRVRKIKKKGKREFIVFAISQLILGKKSNPYLRLVETPRHTVSLNSVQIPEGTDIVRYTVHEPLHSSTCPPDVNYLPPIRRTNVPLSYAFIFHPLYFHIYMYILDSRRGERKGRQGYISPFPEMTRARGARIVVSNVANGWRRVYIQDRASFTVT